MQQMGGKSSFLAASERLLKMSGRCTNFYQLRTQIKQGNGMTTRRNFLKQAILFSGASAFSGVLPDAVKKAYAIAPDPGTTYLDAEHIVILMQENRSFDHVFGTLQGVRGFNDPRALRQADGTPVFLQRSNADETYAPWRLDIKDTRITWMGSVPHTRDSQVDAWNGGGHSHWIDSKRSENKEYAHVPITMGHYTREDVPFYYALADAFTVCDQHYCGVMSSTTPNRSVFWTGTIRDEQKTTSRVYMRNPEFSADEPLTWTTFPERLQRAGIDWKFYQNEITANGGFTEEEFAWLGNLSGNMLEHFANYNVHVSPRYREKLDAQLQALTKRREMHEKELGSVGPASKRAATIRAALKADAQHVEALEKGRKLAERQFSDLSKEEQELYARAFVTNRDYPDYRTLVPIDVEIDGKVEQMNVPKGDVLHQFREDVQSGKLPTISWLAPPGMFDDHPAHPWYGPWFVSEVMKILTEKPEVWKKTIFILTYDENDGYFDHAPSFVAADPLRPETGRASEGIDTALEYSYAKDELAQNVLPQNARSGPIGLGFRVPMIIASPWSRGGWVNSELGDHSSTIQFLEKFVEEKYGKKITETNVSAWRRTVSGDLTSNFRPYNGEPAKLRFLDRNTHLQFIESARNKPIPSEYRVLHDSDVDHLMRTDRNLSTILWQEPGTRPSCALPYELYADGSLDPKSGALSIRMKVGKDLFGKRSAGSPFNVYLYGTSLSSERYEKNAIKGKMMAATYVVRAGDELEELIDLSRFTSGAYDVAVHAPNGFFRHLTGNSNDPALQIVCAYHLSKTGSKTDSSGNLELHMENLRSSPCEVVITDHSYGSVDIVKRLKSGKKTTVLLDLQKSASWYDFSVSVTGREAFMRRYAGHVETNRPSSTDPAMGDASAKKIV